MKQQICNILSIFGNNTLKTTKIHYLTVYTAKYSVMLLNNDVFKRTMKNENSVITTLAQQMLHIETLTHHPQKKTQQYTP